MGETVVGGGNLLCRDCGWEGEIDEATVVMENAKSGRYECPECEATKFAYITEEEL